MLKAVHEVEDMDGGLDAPVSRQEAWPCPRGETGHMRDDHSPALC